MSLRRRLPSPSALFAFEVAARLGSFSRAAQELNITQPAVSHAIAALEQHVGQKLFARAGPRIELTAAGLRLSRVTTRAFRSIEETLADLAEHDGEREVVMLSISSGMATHWLMPRYDAFKSAFPEVDLQFKLIAVSVGGPLGGSDIGLRAATGADSRRLGGWFAPERVVAAGSPGYLRDHGDLADPRRGHTLISLPDHWFDWPEFAAAADLRLPAMHERLAFSDYAVVLQAALNGQGLALTWTSVAARLLLDGMLVKAADRVVRTDRSYHLIVNPQRPQRPVVQSVCEWLIAEMARDEAALAELFG
jgi:DNA-binding transcriptional LysR family regulator